jgi:hypothetical protein
VQFRKVTSRRAALENSESQAGGGHKDRGYRPGNVPKSASLSTHPVAKHPRQNEAFNHKDERPDPSNRQSKSHQPAKRKRSDHKKSNRDDEPNERHPRILGPPLFSNKMGAVRRFDLSTSGPNTVLGQCSRMTPDRQWLDTVRRRAREVRSHLRGRSSRRPRHYERGNLSHGEAWTRVRPYSAFDADPGRVSSTQSWVKMSTQHLLQRY